MEHLQNHDHPAPLRRAVEGRLVGGVAAGIADYFDIDVVLVRIGLVALALVAGIGVPLYLAAWLLVPEEGSDESAAERLLCRGRAHPWPPPFAQPAPDDDPARSTDVPAA